MITRELLRNLGIALACVFITTLLLLANFLGSVIVLVCVAVTLVRRYFQYMARPFCLYSETLSH